MSSLQKKKGTTVNRRWGVSGREREGKKQCTRGGGKGRLAILRGKKKGWENSACVRKDIFLRPKKKGFSVKKRAGPYPGEGRAFLSRRECPGLWAGKKPGALFVGKKFT